MNRVVSGVLLSVAGLVLLANYERGLAAGAAPVAGVAPVAAGVPMAGAPMPGAAMAAGPGTALGAPQTVLHDGTYVGTPAMHRYGTVQVQATVTGGRLGAVDILQSPQGDARSQSLSYMALPKLVSSSLAAQSARVTAVSGATLTSNAYATSLQAALDAAAAGRA